jgi:hypothetical protein
MDKYITASVKPPSTKVKTASFSFNGLAFPCSDRILNYKDRSVYTIRDQSESTQSKAMLNIQKHSGICVQDRPIQYKSKVLNLVAFTNVQWNYREGNVPDRPLDRTTIFVSHNGNAWH